MVCSMRRSKPFNEWSFSAGAAVAFGAMILCLLSLTNGQSFPIWMAIGLVVAFGAGLVSTYGKNTYLPGPVAAGNLVVTVAILGLAVGVVVNARPADAVTYSSVIQSVSLGTTRVSGKYYDVTDETGRDFEMHIGDFSPELPNLEDPAYRGDDVEFVLDRGTAGVLAMRLAGTEYVTASYGDPQLKLYKGVAIGLVLLAAAVAMAFAFGYVRRLRTAIPFRSGR